MVVRGIQLLKGMDEMEHHVQRPGSKRTLQHPALGLGLTVVLSVAMPGCILESSSSSGGGDTPPPPPPPPPPPGSVITCKDYHFNDVEVLPKRITVHNNSDRQLYPVWPPVK